jgi:hypothetical protein
MGILVDVYRNAENYDCSAGGLSSHVKGFTVVNASGPFEPSLAYPGARLVLHEAGDTQRGLRLVPFANEGQHSMFGGNFAAACDSRWRSKCSELLGTHFYGAVAIFDRVERSAAK